MKFEANNKEYEINFDSIHNRFNGVVQGSFILKVSKPFRAESKFVDGDITTRQGVEGINFYKSSAIADAATAMQGARKQDVLFSLSEDALIHIKTTVDSEKVKIAEGASQKPITAWAWAIGGDTHKLYFTTDDLSSIEKHFRPDYKEISNYIEVNQSMALHHLQKYSKPISRDTALYTNGWHEISNKDQPSHSRPAD